MDFGKALNRAWRMIQLDKDAIREVLGDPDALIPALVIFAIGGVASAIGSLNIVGIFVLPILVPIVYFVLIGIVHLVASLLGGTGPYVGTFRAYGHGVGLLTWTNVIPFIGPFIGLVAGLWGIAVGVLVIEENYALSRGKAVVAALCPLILFCLCMGVLFVFFGAAFMAMVLGASANQ